MTSHYPKILIIEHKADDLEKILDTPIIKELIKINPKSVYPICAEDLGKASIEIQNLTFDIAMSDIFFPGAASVDKWGELLGRELLNKGIPIVAVSEHLDKLDIIKLINEYQIVGVLVKNNIHENIGPLLRRLLRERMKKVISPTSSNVVTWLHISDLHFGSPNDVDRTKVEESFFNDISSLQDDGLLLNMIMVTGDIAYTAKENEYILANKFISKLIAITGVPKEQLYIVPGNHDVDRASINPNAKKLCSFNNRNELNTLLRDSSMRSILLEPFRAYGLFLKGLQIGDGSQISDYYSFSRTHQKPFIGIAGLNSAICSGITKNINGTDDDKGNLYISEIQVDPVMKNLDGKHVSIVMMHHPLSYLDDFDSNDIEKILVRKCNILLHGHLHISEFKKIMGMKSELVIIPAGSLYQSRDYVNSYNITTLDIEKRQGTVFYRRYSDMQNAFVKDIDTTGEDLDGSIKFSLNSLM